MEPADGKICRFYVFKASLFSLRFSFNFRGLRVLSRNQQTSIRQLNVLLALINIVNYSHFAAAAIAIKQREKEQVANSAFPVQSLHYILQILKPE